MGDQCLYHGSRQTSKQRTMYGLVSGVLIIGTTNSMAIMQWYLEDVRPSGVARLAAENDIRRDEFLLSEAVPSLERSVPSVTLGVYLGVRNAKLRFWTVILPKELGLRSVEVFRRGVVPRRVGLRIIVFSRACE